MSKLKFKNPQEEPVRVATLDGFVVVVEPGKTREVPEKFRKECLGAGLNEVKSGGSTAKSTASKTDGKTENETSGTTSGKE